MQVYTSIIHPSIVQPTIAENHHKEWRRLILGLGKHSARFVEIRQGSRRPTRKGWNQPENTLSADQALRLVGKGYNIGLAAGAGNLYVFDFDRDAERGHECAQLSGGAYTYRANAPDRAKFIFRCEDRLPIKHVQGDMDLLGWNANDTHSQATIAGVHNSGAPILWGGHTIPTLDKETVEALWEEWTGKELFREHTPAPPVSHADAREDDIRAALACIPAQLDYAGGEGWLDVLMAVHSVLPDERGVALCEEWSPGYPGEVAEKFASFRGTGTTIATLFYIAKQHGYHPPRYAPPPDDAVREELRGLRAWVCSGDCNAYLKEKGIARVGTAVSVLLPIVDLAIERGTMRVLGSMRELAGSWGISRMTIWRTLEKLVSAGLIRTENTEKGMIVDLSFLEVDLDGTALSSIRSNSVVEETVPSRSSSFEMRHLGDDAFSSYPYAYAQKRRAAAQGETVLMMSLGSTGWLLWKYLEKGGTINELSEESALTPATVRASVKKFLSCNLLDVETVGKEKYYCLRPDAESHLDTIRPHMVTNGVGQMRLARTHADTADYAALRLRRRKHMDPKDVLWWSNLRDDKDAAACRIFDHLESQGFDARAKVGKEKRVRHRSRHDHGEAWRTWGRALWEEWVGLGDLSEDDRLRLLTLARTTEETDAKTFSKLHVDMRERVREMKMLSRKVARYMRPQEEEEEDEPVQGYSQLSFNLMEVPHG